MKSFSIKSIDQENSDEWLSLLISLERETDFLFFEKNERKMDRSKCKKFVKELIRRNNGSVIFLAFNDEGEAIGHVTGVVQKSAKSRHVMQASIGVLKKHPGIGRELGIYLISHAKKFNICRVEGTIRSDNNLSLRLAEKFGFNIEGVKRKSIFSSGEFHDEFLMGLLL